MADVTVRLCHMQQEGRLWKVEVMENPIEVVPVFCRVLCYNLFKLFHVKQVDLRTMNYTCPLLMILVCLSLAK